MLGYLASRRPIASPRGMAVDSAAPREEANGRGTWPNLRNFPTLPWTRRGAKAADACPPQATIPFPVAIG